MEQTFVRRKYDPSAREFLEHLCREPHKNLPVIVEVTEEYYVMEYVTGCTLTEAMAGRQFSREEARDCILQLLDAVEVLHRFRIVHRDIKPDNIVLGDDGVLRLIDFDIARRIVTGKRRDTQYLGTADFAAPEQYGFTQTNERTDIYAIGVVYNLLLTGKHPREELPRGEAGKIIRKCTQIDNERRYVSIAVLRRDVQGGRQSVFSALDFIPGFRSRNLFVIGLTLLLIALMIIGFGLIFAEYFTDFDPAELPDMLFALVYVAVFYWLVIGKNLVLATPLPIRRFWLKKLVLAVIWYLGGCAWISFFTSIPPAESLLANPIAWPIVAAFGAAAAIFKYNILGL